MAEEIFTQSESTRAMKPKKGFLGKFFANRFTVLVIGLIIGLVVGYVVLGMYRVSPQISATTAAQQAEQQKLMAQYVASVGKLMILPKGEDPVIATITDAKALAKDQIFYSNAQNGDIVMVYQKAMQAIIYSPSRNVIVNVGPVYYQNQATATSTASTATTTKKK
jgi:hypothetical protein